MTFKLPMYIHPEHLAEAVVAEAMATLARVLGSARLVLQTHGALPVGRHVAKDQILAKANVTRDASAPVTAENAGILRLTAQLEVGAVRLLVGRIATTMRTDHCGRSRRGATRGE